MFVRWLKYLFWRPFEEFCRRYPLVPLKATVTEPVEGLTSIRVDNWVTRSLGRLGGGFDYSVSYIVEGALMVDTAFPLARRSLQKTLVQLGYDRTLRYVVNTHAHEDHSGNNDLLQQISRAEILAHPLAVPLIRHSPEIPWYRHFLFGPPTFSEVQPIPETLQTESFTFQVHHMPGHSPDHICLFEPSQRWLLSGDLYIAAKLDTQLRDVDGPAWIRSLEEALALKPVCLFDAHGLVLTAEHQVRELLTAKLEFLTDIQRRILEVADQAQPVQAITNQVFNTGSLVDRISMSEGWPSLLTCSDFSRTNLVMSFLQEAYAQGALPSST